MGSRPLPTEISASSWNELSGKSGGILWFLKILGYNPGERPPDRNFWRLLLKNGVLSPKTFWGPPGRFPEISADFSKIDPRKKGNLGKSWFFRFFENQVFQKNHSEISEGGPRFFGKKNFFYVKVSGFNHGFQWQKLETWDKILIRPLFWLNMVPLKSNSFNVHRQLYGLY